MTRASSLRPSTTATARGTPGLPNLRTCPVWRKIVSVNASPKHLKKPAPPASTEASTKASAQKAGQTPSKPAPAWAQAMVDGLNRATRSEEHTSELQSLMRISYAVFCLKKKKKTKQQYHNKTPH